MDINSTQLILQRLANYYREVLKYVTSSASRVLQNVASGQKYGLVADLYLLVKDSDSLKKQIISIKKPKKNLELEKFKDESNPENIEESENEEEENIEITNEEIAWSALNKIWRTQQNNPYERETNIGEFLVKCTVNKKNYLAPLLLTPVEISFDPTTSTFHLSRLSVRPDLNRSLIASVLSDDSLSPARNQINELFLQAEEVDIELIKKIVNLLSNHAPSLKDIEIIKELNSLNDIAERKEQSFITNASIVFNTPRTGSFTLDDLDALSTLEIGIEDTPIEDLLTVNFEELDSESMGSTNLKQETYFFPLKSNRQQQLIADNVMSKKLTVVWGPPGTGKSETISNLICHLIANGKSVLVTSQQQKALEVVKNKLQKNISLPAPKHPNLTVPLEMALIKGEKESTLAEDIKSKLDALNVYTIGINSRYELDKELEDLKTKLKQNKERVLILAKRFSELKLQEKDRVDSKDSPVKLQDLKNYDILDINETLPFVDQKKNAELIKNYIELLIKVQQIQPYINSFPAQLSLLKEEIIALNKVYKTLERLQKILSASSKKELDLISELVSSSINQNISLIVSQELNKSWSKLKNLASNISLGNQDLTKKITKIMSSPESSYNAAEKILKRLKSYEKDIINYNIETEGDLYSLSIAELEQDLEILKNTKVNILTNFLDKNAKEALQRSLTLYKIPHFDWRSKELICTQLKKTIAYLKANKILVTIIEELKALDLDINIEDFEAHHLPNFNIELESLINVGRILKALHSSTSLDSIPNIIANYIELENLEKVEGVIDSNNSLKNDLAELKIQSPMKNIENEFGILNVKLAERLIENCTDTIKKVEVITQFIEVDELLKNLPGSKNKIIKLVEQNKYELPAIFEKTELIVERHRLGQIYGRDVTEETTQIVAKALKKLRSNRQELIFDYILKTRLRTLYEASNRRIANANLIKLKNLLGKRKKTLNFLRRKDSIDFSLVLEYFPCWIASIDDVARYFPLEKGLFDYIIVDESSQCSQTAIPHLFFRAKNAVIVGDDKQLPNANLRFLQKGIMDSLQKKYNIHNHDKSQFFDCKEYSLLSFAQAATPHLALIEHFRCDPTIIEWANKHVYNNMMKIMTPVWENRFNPPMEVRYIANGAEDLEEKVNKVEAQAIIEEIKNLISDKSSEGLTIGVISPFRAQADYISELIYNEISPETIKEFDLQSRTVDGFQGDERDIILYSMRFSGNGKPGSVTTIETGFNEEGFKRMNVAFTRARRKVIVFTSEKISAFPGKYIKSFMEHAQHVQETYSDPLQPKNDQFDSKFEEDVCRMLRGKGLNVVTQFPCAGYRIDQVIFDKDGRTLALECDGDFKLDDGGELPPEHYMRQATIERVTEWEVYRILASKFYMNPEETIEEIITILNQQPTHTERKLNQIEVVDKKTDTFTDDHEENEDDISEMREVLKVVEDTPKVKVDERKSSKKDKAEQPSLFIPDLGEAMEDRDTWFSLSHWGKTSGNLSSFQNRFAYSLGMYLSKGSKLTDKQHAYGEKILESALKQGFNLENTHKKSSKISTVK